MKRTINIDFESRETGEVFTHEGITINCKDSSKNAFLDGIAKYLKNSGIIVGMLKYGWYFNIYVETIITADMTAAGQIEVNPFAGQFKLNIA